MVFRTKNKQFRKKQLTMNIFEKLFKKLFVKKEKQTIAGKSINELIEETLNERKKILKEIEVNHPELVEIDITGEIPKMSDKKTKEETTQPNETTETILPKKKKYKKKPKPKQ